METQKVYILRHGNTFDKGDIVTRVGARTDLPLSRSGLAQANGLADYFKATAFQSIYSSPLRRTLQTAETIIAAQPRNLTIIKADFLKEIDYGPDENKPEAEVITRLGSEALAIWDRDAVPPDGWNVDVKAITSAWVNFFRGLSVPKTDASPILVVTSNGIARFVLDAVTEPLPQGLDRKLATASFGCVSVSSEGRTQIEFWNRRA